MLMLWVPHKQCVAGHLLSSRLHFPLHPSKSFEGFIIQGWEDWSESYRMI